LACFSRNPTGQSLLITVQLPADENQDAGSQSKYAKEHNGDIQHKGRGDTVNDEKNREHKHPKVLINYHGRDLSALARIVTPKRQHDFTN
jgi:hypothetical protein